MTDSPIAKTHPPHAEPAGPEPRPHTPTWPGAPRTPLPAPSAALVRRTRSQPGIQADTLALVLKLCAGLRPTAAQRISQWAGDADENEQITAFAAVRAVPGVPTGVHGYVAEDHQLALVTSDVSGIPGDAPVSLVLTCVRPEGAPHSGTSTGGTAQSDRCCARAAAREAAVGLDLDVRVRRRWSSRALAAAVGANLREECIVAVIDLTGK